MTSGLLVRTSANTTDDFVCGFGGGFGLENNDLEDGRLEGKLSLLEAIVAAGLFLPKLTLCVLSIRIE